MAAHSPIGPALAADAPLRPPRRRPLLLPIPPPVPPIPFIPELPPAPPGVSPLPPPVSSLLSGPAAEVVSITNARRVEVGCNPLKVDHRLVRSAQRHSADMAARGFFGHQDPEGQGFADRERSAGYPMNSGGENVARGQETAAEVMSVWMNSPPHRRNILNCGFTSIGVGYVAVGHYWTQDFGS
ncbi:MAG: CAP domain-containing protein [Pseudonocardia sp.]|nr:CAP domain-containing protein [Pseudonocardia sp.]